MKLSKDGNTFIHIFSGKPPLEALAASTLLQNSNSFQYWNKATKINVGRLTVFAY